MIAVETAKGVPSPSHTPQLRQPSASNKLLVGINRVSFVITATIQFPIGMFVYKEVISAVTREQFGGTDIQFNCLTRSDESLR